MEYKWIQLLLSGFIIVTVASCSPDLSSLPSNNGLNPSIDIPVDKLKTISPMIMSATVTNAQRWTAIPITQTLPNDTPEQPTVSGASISATLEPSLQQMIIQAKEDLARRLGVSVDIITTGAIIGQEFSTDAFYCRTSKDRIASDESPQVMPGQSILLGVSDRHYEYHASGQTVIFCRPLP